MTYQHSIFIEGHFADDGSHQIGLAVLCRCSAILLEREGADPQVSLDEINEVRWAHYDQDVPHLYDCAICGDE